MAVNEGSGNGTFFLTDVSALSTNEFSFDNGVSNLGPLGYIDKIAAQSYKCLKKVCPEKLKEFIRLVQKDDDSFASSLSRLSAASGEASFSFHCLSFVHVPRGVASVASLGMPIVSVGAG